MKRVRLSEIARKPRYLAEFPLLGKTIASISQCVQKDEGYLIGSPGMIPPFGQALRTGETYALTDDEGESAEVKILKRESQTAIAVPLTDDDAIVLESLQPSSIAELRIIRVRESDFLSVTERLEFQKVISSIASLREHPDYNFTNKLIQSAIDSEETKSKLDATNEDEKSEIQTEIILKVLESRSLEDKERSSKDEELSLEMLDLSRRQLEILGGLEPGELGDLPASSVQTILSAINSTDENSDSESEPEKPKRGRPAKKDKQQTS
jgi:hypothetical protein